MNKELKQEACDFASNRNLGAGHGYPSFEANLLEKGFIAGATSNYVKKQKLEYAIQQLKYFKKHYQKRIGTGEIWNRIKKLEEKLKEHETN